MYSTTCLLVLASVLFLIVTVTADDITFENVEIQGLSVFIEKFNKTIKSSNSLKDHVPKYGFDTIEIIGQNVPVLYKNSITDISTLDELNMENDQLAEIQPGAFKNLENLRKLSLKNNKLEEIKEGVFNGLQISTLDLSKNSLTTIESAAFNDMPSLLNINFVDNKITTWNENWFENTPLLTRISMQHNEIEKFPIKAFKNLAGEKIYGKLNLKLNLIFSYNKIKELDAQTFEGLSEMNNLWLDGNEISDLNENWLNNMSVDDLKINDNNITCVNGDYGKIFAANSVNIDGNPWNCECLEKIVDWKKKNSRNVQLFYAQMTCDAERIKKKMNDLEKRLKEIQAEDLK